MIAHDRDQRVIERKRERKEVSESEKRKGWESGKGKKSARNKNICAYNIDMT